MNAEMFEKWFELLCQVLKDDYGECRIHMDGASYYKRILDKLPTKSNKKPVIQSWLMRHNVAFNVKDTKAVLMDLVPSQPSPAAGRDVCDRGGAWAHIPLDPPLPPEPQPIEKFFFFFWGGGQSKTSWYNDRWEIST
ncbi:TPA: hypothetical protein N0F65_000452 [Lagenidium giganteum]|uniref:Uncharacterized protein n=1 Tax=Lagenidium giganteum TaxID=4803 RepID=A0AAV2Z261_9STRA|nr:TPA: hypothetical protein N0F65_000452 [Lagenidium giganteum]